MKVDRALQVEAIDTLVAKLNAHYVFPDKARQLKALLRQRQREGKYDGVTDGKQLAEQLTDDLHGAAHDLHMEVLFSRAPVPPDDALALARDLMQRRLHDTAALVAAGR